jgi:hypothetical protein
MKSPRIYTYKVTFEEIPHWYWGVHKEKKFGETYLGSPVTHKWMWDFYTPCLQICEEFPYTDEGWMEALGVEKRLILPDLNDTLCLNEGCGARVSLEISRKTALRLHEEKTPEGKSKHAVKMVEKSLEEKDEFGRSVVCVKGALKAMELRVGVTARTPQKMSEDGRKGGKAATSQKDGFGRCIAAMRMYEAAHREKDELGRSVLGVKAAERLNSVSPEEKTARARKGGEKGGRSTSSQVWESLEDGFKSNAGAVANHNRRNGWDPDARIRLS